MSEEERDGRGGKEADGCGLCTLPTWGIDIGALCKSRRTVNVCRRSVSDGGRTAGEDGERGGTV